jgi:hypothetical protein
MLAEIVVATCEFPPPKNLKAVCRFLGMVGSYVFFVKDLSSIAELLHVLKLQELSFSGVCLNKKPLIN